MIEGGNNSTPLDVSPIIGRIRYTTQTTDDRDIDADADAELHSQLRNSEKRNRPDSVKISRHIKTEYRTEIIRWLFQLCSHFGFGLVTTFTMVQILDRVFSSWAPPLDQLQLVGVACFLISAKIEENTVPPVRSLNELTESSYTIPLILEMESLILNLLSCDVLSVTPSHFFGIYQPHLLNKEELSSLSVRQKEQFHESIWDLVLRAYEGGQFIGYLPSLLLAGGVAAARSTLHLNEPWPASLQQLTQYPREDVIHISNRLLGGEDEIIRQFDLGKP